MLGLQLPDLCELVDYWNRHAGKDTPAERTMKSDILCEWEAISRRAKVDWARSEGHDVLNLQHDGVVLALRPGVPWEHAVQQLTRVCSVALGYTQPVEAKPMEVEDDPRPPPPIEPACGRRPGAPAGWVAPPPGRRRVATRSRRRAQ